MTTKLCRACGIEKSVESFQPKGDGSRRRGTCRKCQRSKHKQPPCNTQRLCQQCRVVCSSRLCDACQRTERAAASRRYRAQIRQIVIAHYGGECTYCGENEPMFLTMDHVNGDGNNHRKEVKFPHICLWLYRERGKTGQFPPEFQVLCWSCNSAKHIYGEEAVKEAIRRSTMTSTYSTLSSSMFNGVAPTIQKWVEDNGYGIKLGGALDKNGDLEPLKIEIKSWVETIGHNGVVNHSGDTIVTVEFHETHVRTQKIGSKGVAKYYSDPACTPDWIIEQIEIALQ